ncbi:MAG TPA: hypothetical protein VJ933_08090 [Phaeodactylibacter sp.]|nr:hypothetical protein [Phaeodactylibacter sp.]
MKTHIITTAIIIASTLFANAEVELLNISPASVGTCDGEAIIDASGTAGPFAILLDGEQIEEDVNGLYTLENLCSGTHTITVMSSFGCEVVQMRYLLHFLIKTHQYA